MINGLCQRCNTKADATLPNGYLYCRECIGVGRISEENKLERNIEKSTYPKIVTPLSWRGKLTDQQELISNELVNSFKERRNHPASFFIFFLFTHVFTYFASGTS